ncbi:hypothetical protein Leryth_022763 [Lithospermum erythrorhizon]|nr:hypothetical protein Leryth_022763 [Lithospermum erythrorhizon]
MCDNELVSSFQFDMQYIPIYIILFFLILDHVCYVLILS